MADHAAGIGYAHSMGIARQPSRRATILARWNDRWKPEAMLRSKREADDPADQFAIYFDSFRRRMDTLLNGNIAWSAITKGDLDSPFQLGAEFDRALCLAIERRRCRMGRTKGAGKKYANRK